MWLYFEYLLSLIKILKTEILFLVTLDTEESQLFESD